MARSRALAVRVVGHARSFSASRTLSSYTTKADTTDGKYDYDLLVIGSGPAGYAAAVRAWDLGKTVCVVEKDWLGGAHFG
jgi:heterodisulfide reductase subunit A-like polyferredoxin